MRADVLVAGALTIPVARAGDNQASPNDRADTLFRPVERAKHRRVLTASGLELGEVRDARLDYAGRIEALEVSGRGLEPRR